jgi:hypothetical protein
VRVFGALPIAALLIGAFGVYSYRAEFVPRLAGLAGVARGSAGSAGSGLPNPLLTPGAVDPRVTQSNIEETICVRGWTRTVRPPESYTEPLKREQINRYG